MTSAWAFAGRSHSNCLKPLPGPCPSLRSQLGPVRDVSISHASRGICISVGCEIQSPSSAEWDIYAALLPYMLQWQRWRPKPTGPGTQKRFPDSQGWTKLSHRRSAVSKQMPFATEFQCNYFSGQTAKTKEKYTALVHMLSAARYGVILTNMLVVMKFIVKTGSA